MGGCYLMKTPSPSRWNSSQSFRPQIALSHGSYSLPPMRAFFLINDLKCDVLLHQVNNNSTPRKNNWLWTRLPPKYATYTYCPRKRRNSISTKNCIATLNQKWLWTGKNQQFKVIFSEWEKTWREWVMCSNSTSYTFWDQDAAMKIRRWDRLVPTHQPVNCWDGAVYLHKHAKTKQPITVKKFKLPGDQYYRNPDWI